MSYRNFDTIAIFEAYGQVSKQDRFEKYKENIMKDPNMSAADKSDAIAKLEKALLGANNSSTPLPAAAPKPSTSSSPQAPTTLDDKEQSDSSQTDQFNPNAPKKPIQYNDDGTFRVGPEIQDADVQDDDEDWDTTTVTYAYPDGSTGAMSDDSGSEMSTDDGSEGEWVRVQGTPYSYNTKSGEIKKDQDNRSEWVQVPGTMELRNRRTGESRPLQGTDSNDKFETVPASDEEMGLDR